MRQDCPARSIRQVSPISPIGSIRAICLALAVLLALAGACPAIGAQKAEGGESSAKTVPKAEAQPGQAKSGQEKSRQQAKRQAKPQSPPLLAGGFDPTTPMSPESELKSLMHPPVSCEPGRERAEQPGYAVGGKLRLAPGATPAPGGVSQSGGLRAWWQSPGGLAVGGGLGYDPETKTGKGQSATAGPNGETQPGPAAGVVLKYSF